MPTNIPGIIVQTNPTISFNKLSFYFSEEIIGSNSAMWFAPDGNRLAYVKFNDSTVSNSSANFV